MIKHCCLNSFLRLLPSRTAIIVIITAVACLNASEGSYDVDDEKSMLQRFEMCQLQLNYCFKEGHCLIHP